MTLGGARVPAARKQRIKQLTYWGLQPTLTAIALWLPMSGAGELSYHLFWISFFGLLILLEILIPARPDW